MPRTLLRARARPTPMSGTRDYRSLVPLLALAGACAAGDPVLDVEQQTASLSKHGSEEITSYTQEELEVLASDPAVEQLNLPFADAPPADEALHVTMSDGVRVALAIYYPSDLDPQARAAPTVYADSWYGRRNEATGQAIELYRAAGFVVVLGDSRGFGASFGAQPGLMPEAARRDQREVIAWIAAQPWSNGKVAGIGISLSGTLADIMSGSGAEALAAVILRSSDYDAYGLNMLPGGVPNLNMQGLIAGFMMGMRDPDCAADAAACARLGVLPVDGDADLRLLQAAFVDHRQNVDLAALGALVYRDDALGSGTVADMSPSDRMEQVRRAKLPARVSAGWLDGLTAAGALARFQAAPELPMELSIGAANHMGGIDADPFSREPFRPARPSAQVDYAKDVAFVQRVLAGRAIERVVDYYVLGADTWKTTQVWPPAGVAQTTLHFTRRHLTVRSTGHRGERAYAVDASAASGPRFNRWSSQYGEAVFYGDRRSAPGRRLAFEGPRMQRDMELVGAPEICLRMRSDRSDGLVVAYLEDVAPDGRITYLTEGELRLLHRKTARGGCDPAAGTERSFERADGAAVSPGELMEVELPLWPTAALIRAGHRLRVSLAGADDGTFPLLTEQPANWTVAYGAGGSTLTVPLRPWVAP